MITYSHVVIFKKREVQFNKNKYLKVKQKWTTAYAYKSTSVLTYMIV